jgi:hypothetical protein
MFCQLLAFFARADGLRRFPLGGYGMSHALEPFKKTQFEGAVPTVYAVSMADKGGQYICAPAIPGAGSALSQSEELADNLMELTRNVVREKMRSESVEKGCPLDDLVLH